MTHLLNSSAIGNVVAWQDSSREVIDLNTLSALSPIQTQPNEAQFDDRSYCLTSVLEENGYCVTVLPTEEAVLQSVLDRVPDLLLIYLQTSGSEGYDFCKILRHLPRSRTVPVVFVGVRDTALELTNALRCGGNEYIQLPIRPEEVWLRIERHLHTIKLMRSLEAEKDSLHQKIWSYHTILRQQEEIQVSLTKENQALQRLAFMDGLTKVANRRRFNDTLSQLWQSAIAKRQPISLLLCDIDYFKRYNDTYGHLTGDTCLQAVADALVRAAHRQDDQVARYGGEEFAILLPATDAKGAQQVALAAHSELARAQMPHKASLVKPFVSLSIGICTLMPDDAQQQSEILIHGADEALYAAKLGGRDRSVANTAEGLITIESITCTYSGPDGGSDCAHEGNPIDIGSKDASKDATRHLPAKLVVNPTISAAAC